MHDQLGVRAISTHVGFVKHKHFSKVIVPIHVGFVSATLGISHAKVKQAGRSDPIGHDIVIALHEVTNAGAKQCLVVHEWRSIWVKDERGGSLFISDDKELVVGFELGFQCWIDNSIGALGSL